MSQLLFSLHHLNLNWWSWKIKLLQNSALLTNLGILSCVMPFKLMQSNQLWVRFRLKSDLNCHLISFFYWKMSSYSIEIVETIRIWTRNLNPNSNMIKNLSNLIKNGQKQLDFWLILTFSINFFDLFIDNFKLFIDFWSFYQFILIF